MKITTRQVRKIIREIIASPHDPEEYLQDLGGMYSDMYKELYRRRPKIPMFKTIEEAEAAVEELWAEYEAKNREKDELVQRDLERQEIKRRMQELMPGEYDYEDMPTRSGMGRRVEHRVHPQTDRHNLLSEYIQEVYRGDELLQEGILDFFSGILKAVLALFGLQIGEAETKTYTSAINTANGLVTQMRLAGADGNPIKKYSDLDPKDPKHQAALKKVGKATLKDVLKGVQGNLNAMTDVPPFPDPPEDENDKAAAVQYKEHEGKIKKGSSGLGQLLGATKFLADKFPEFKDVHAQISGNKPTTPADIFYQAGVLAKALQASDMLSASAVKENVQLNRHMMFLESLLILEEKESEDKGYTLKSDIKKLRGMVPVDDRNDIGPFNEPHNDNVAITSIDQAISAQDALFTIRKIHIGKHFGKKISTAKGSKGKGAYDREKALKAEWEETKKTINADINALQKMFNIKEVEKERTSDRTMSEATAASVKKHAKPLADYFGRDPKPEAVTAIFGADSKLSDDDKAYAFMALRMLDTDTTEFLTDDMRSKISSSAQKILDQEGGPDWVAAITSVDAITKKLLASGAGDEEFTKSAGEMDLGEGGDEETAVGAIISLASSYLSKHEDPTELKGFAGLDDAGKLPSTSIKGVVQKAAKKAQSDAEKEAKKKTAGEIKSVLADIMKDPTKVAKALMREHPQVNAVVLAAMAADNVKTSTAVLALMPPKARVDVAARMAVLKSVPGKVLSEIVGKLSGLPKEEWPKIEGDHPVDGKSLMIDILREIGPEASSQIFEALALKDGPLAEDLRWGMFKFEDILKLKGTEVQTILRMIDGDDLAPALLDADKELQAYVLENMSTSDAKWLSDQMAIAKKGDTKQAQQEIITTILKLAEEGTIKLSR